MQKLKNMAMTKLECLVHVKGTFKMFLEKF